MLSRDTYDLSCGFEDGKTEILGIEPAHPLIGTHREYIITKDLGVKQDLGNRAHVKGP